MNTAAVLKVGDGRGFVVRWRNYLDLEERVVITAAHCLPRLPKPHPGRHLNECTWRLLSPLSRKRRTVWAQVLYVDPMADIAVLGSPDGQAFYDEATAYEELTQSAGEPFAIAEAPAQVPGHEVVPGGVIRIDGELVEVEPQQVPVMSPGKASVSLLSLSGEWFTANVDADGVIGVVSVDCMSPVLTDSLSIWLWRSILAAQKSKIHNGTD